MTDDSFFLFFLRIWVAFHSYQNGRSLRQDQITHTCRYLMPHLRL